jgi:hypothetical protein
MSLSEIEKDYARNIVKFFCKEFSNRYDALFLIENQIRRRLLDNKLILDYKVDMPILDRCDIRDYRIDSVLENKEFFHKEIEIFLKYKDLTFEIIRYEKEQIKEIN